MTHDSSTTTYHTHLLTSLTTINTYNPPVHTCSTGWSFNGLVSGPTSIAYLFYRLSTLYPEDFEWKGQGLLEWAEAYVRLGGRVACDVNGNGSTYMGGGGSRKVGKGQEGAVGVERYIGCDEEVTWMVVSGVIEGDEGVVGRVVGVGRRRIDQLTKNAGSIVNGHGSGDGNNDGKTRRGLYVENLAWWAGYLYLLRVVKTAFPEVKSANMIRDITERVVNVVLSCTEVKTGEFGVEDLELLVDVMTQIVLSRERDHIDGLDDVLGTILSFQDQHSGGWGVGTAFIVNSLESIKIFLPRRGEPRKSVAIANEKARNFLSRMDVGTLPPTMVIEGLFTLALAFTDPEDQRFHDVLAGLTNECLDSTRPGWKKDAGIKDQWVGLRTGEAGRAWIWAMAELTTKEADGESGVVKRSILGYNDV